MKLSSKNLWLGEDPLPGDTHGWVSNTRGHHCPQVLLSKD